MIKNGKISKLLTGRNDVLLNSSVLLLRLTIGIILFDIGAGKLFGWFGGFGMQQTIKFYAQSGFSVPLTYLSSITECFGGLLLVLGLFTRPALIAVIINMAVATISMLPGGFIGPNGASYPFIFLVISVVIFLTGPMNYSIDNYIIIENKEELF